MNDVLIFCPLCYRIINSFYNYNANDYYKNYNG